CMGSPWVDAGERAHVASARRRDGNVHAMRAEHCGGRRCGPSAQARAGFPAGLLQHRTVAAPAGVTARDSALAGAPAQPGAYAGICIRLRRLLSKADLGTKRLRRLTVAASRLAV